MYIIHFKTIRNKLNALGKLNHSSFNNKLMGPVSIFRLKNAILPKE